MTDHSRSAANSLLTTIMWKSKGEHSRSDQAGPRSSLAHGSATKSKRNQCAQNRSTHQTHAKLRMDPGPSDFAIDINNIGINNIDYPNMWNGRKSAWMDGGGYGEDSAHGLEGIALA